MSTFKFIVSDLEVKLISKAGSDFDGHTQVVIKLKSSNLLDTKEYRKSIVLDPSQAKQIEFFEKMAAEGDYKPLQSTVDACKFEIISVTTPPYYLLDSDKAVRIDKNTGNPIVKTSMSVFIETYKCIDDTAKMSAALAEATATINRICKWVETEPHSTNEGPVAGNEADTKPKFDPVTGKPLQ